MCILLRQVSNEPRSSLSDMDDNGLHQVALSLLHEPDASQVRERIEANAEIWEHCYQPEEVVGEIHVDGSDFGHASVVEHAVCGLGWTLTRDVALMEEFYTCVFLLESDGRQI